MTEGIMLGYTDSNLAVLLREMTSFADSLFHSARTANQWHSASRLNISTWLSTVPVRAATATRGQKVFKHEPRRIFGSQFQNSVVQCELGWRFSWGGDLAGLAIYSTAQSLNIPTVHYFPANLINARLVQQLTLKAQWSLYVPPVVTICTAIGHYLYRQWSLYVPPVVAICDTWFSIHKFHVLPT